MHGRVPLQAAAQFFQAGQLRQRQDTELGQGDILGRHAMSLAHDKAVTPRPGGISGIVAHLVEVKGGDDIGCRERAAEVMGLAGAHHVHDQVAHLRRQAAQ